MTGRRYNQLNYHPMSYARLPAFQAARIYSYGRRVSTICFALEVVLVYEGQGLLFGSDDTARLHDHEAELLGA